MTSDLVPRLVVLDLRFEADAGALIARLQVVEVAAEVERLGVRWESAPDEPGFVAVGGGVAHVPADVVAATSDDDVALASAGDHAWRWHRELPPEHLVMLVIVLPPGQTLAAATPGPVAAKLHADRIAVCAMLEADAAGRAELTFTLATAADAAAAVAVLATAGGRPASTDSRTA